MFYFDFLICRPIHRIDYSKIMAKGKKQVSKITMSTPAEPTSQQPTTVISSKSIYLSYLCLFLLGFLLYANTIKHDYVLDDAAAITKNKIVQQGVSGIPELLKTGFYYGYFGYNNNLYRPLPLITFAIGHSLWGNNPHPDHLINVLLFALVGVLLCYTLILLLTRQRWLLAIVISALFIAHPIHTEVVANIKSRDEILSLLFSLLSLTFFIRYSQSRKLLFLIFGGASLFLAMLSKESAIAFVLIIPLSIYFFISQSKSKGFKFDLKSLDQFNIKATASAGIAVLLYLLIRYSLFHNDPQTTSKVMILDNVMGNLSFFERLPTAVFILGKYLGLLILPHPLVYDYSFKEIVQVKWSDPFFWVSAIVYISLLVFAVIQFLKKNILSYSILFFLISVFIVSNLLVTIGAGMAERFLFTPSIAFCIAAAYLLFKLTGASTHIIKTKQIALPVFVLIVSLYSFKTVTRNSNWENQLALFSNDVKNAPRSARVHYSLGNELFENGKLTKDVQKQKEMYNRAEAELLKTIDIYPEYAEAIISLGNVYQEKGDYVKANEYISKVSSGNFDMGGRTQEQLKYNKANALLDLKDYANAIIYYRQAIEANPSSADSYVNMGLAYKALGNYDSAIACINKALIIKPNSHDALLNLGSCYSDINDFTNAILNFKKAIALNPSSGGAYINLGNIYNRTNQLDEAEKAFKKGYELDPNIPEASYNLGYYYLNKKDYKTAITYFQQAEKLRPGYLDALVNLSFCASKLNLYQDVIDYAQKVIAIRADIPDMYFYIAFAYDRLGNKALAQEYQKKGNALKGK